MRRGSVAKEARQLAAKARQAVRDSRTDEQQHRKLIDTGHGHCREVVRLRDRMTTAALKKEKANAPTAD
jgi:hypothetical protein